MLCRRMYDAIIQCSPLLPAGVTLAEVLQGSAAADVKEIVASLPDSGTISAAAMISAGIKWPVQSFVLYMLYCYICWGRLCSCSRCLYAHFPCVT